MGFVCSWLWTAVGVVLPRRMGPTVVHGAYRYFRARSVEGRWKNRWSGWTAVGVVLPRRVGPTVVHGVYRYFRSSPVESRVEVPVVGVDCSWGFAP